MNLEEEIKKAELEKIRAETKSINRNRWRFFLQSVLAAIIAIPVMWFYFSEVALPIHSRENLQLARENEVVRDSLASVAENFERERLRLIDEQEQLLARIQEMGAVEPPSPISLSAGWNLVGYTGSTVLTPEAAFESIADAILLARDAQGNVFFPRDNIKNLSSIEPGKGYMVYVTRDAILTFPEP
ncbi:MAG: hypothetical protein GVY15_01215 [Bacteroidetes bacterium]|nr:hypothetical protein [Bacteroidota bacterium]